MRKIVLVTGSSRGIGAATALLLAHRGYDVCINYVDPASEGRADKLVKEMRKVCVRAIAVRADVADSAQIRKLFATIDKKLGKVTALVNNAGIPGERKPFVDHSEPDFNRVLAVNLMGTVNCTKEALKRMAKSRGGEGGAIVNVSSSATVTGGRNLVAYVAAKGGIESFTRAVAKDYAYEGVRVNAVCPGIIATEQVPTHDKAWVERTKASIPMRRFGESSEVAKVIASLLSDETSYITGSVIDINGGR